LEKTKNSKVRPAFRHFLREALRISESHRRGKILGMRKNTGAARGEIFYEKILKSRAPDSRSRNETILGSFLLKNLSNFKAPEKHRRAEDSRHAENHRRDTRGNFLHKIVQVQSARKSPMRSNSKHTKVPAQPSTGTNGHGIQPSTTLSRTSGKARFFFASPPARANFLPTRGQIFY
jgi:hypothetical protein